MKKAEKGTSLSKRSFEKLVANKKALVGLVMLVVISVLCFGAPIFSNQDPLAIDIALKYAPPSAEHPLGCDAKWIHRRSTPLLRSLPPHGELHSST